VYPAHDYAGHQVSSIGQEKARNCCVTSCAILFDSIRKLRRMTHGTVGRYKSVRIRLMLASCCQPKRLKPKPPPGVLKRGVC